MPWYYGFSFLFQENLRDNGNSVKELAENIQGQITQFSKMMSKLEANVNNQVE